MFPPYYYDPLFSLTSSWCKTLSLLFYSWSSPGCYLPPYKLFSFNGVLATARKLVQSNNPSQFYQLSASFCRDTHVWKAAGVGFRRTSIILLLSFIPISWVEILLLYDLNLLYQQRIYYSDRVTQVRKVIREGTWVISLFLFQLKRNTRVETLNSLIRLLGRKSSNPP